MSIKKRVKLLLRDLNLWDAYRSIRKKVRPNEYDKWEEAIYEKRKIFYAQFIQPGNLCFDVGANMGNRSVIFLELGAKVIAVEPQQDCSKHLEKKFKGANLVVVAKGLSDKPGVEEMFISNTNTLSTFSRDWVENMGGTRFEGHKWNKKRQMEMTTLDQLIEEHGKPIFCKIDVEGYELEVLKGLHNPVNMVSIEYAVPEKIDKVKACLEHLYQLDPNLQVNYSSGESMDWAMETWLSYEQMQQEIQTERFIQSSSGDIYIRSKGAK